jgi:hypothetical protein
MKAPPHLEEYFAHQPPVRLAFVFALVLLFATSRRCAVL